MKKFLKKVGAWLIVWGKPLVRKALKTKLVPMLQKKINAGAIDNKVDQIIAEVVNEFCEKYL